jgi:hypothetical protein
MKSFKTLFQHLNIIKKVKSRRMRWVWHIARMGRRGMHMGFWWESLKEKDHYEDKRVGECITLKWILRRWDREVSSISLGGSEENHTIHQSKWPEPRPRYEHGTTGTRGGSDTH